jgi:hypothetical protein
MYENYHFQLFTSHIGVSMHLARNIFVSPSASPRFEKPELRRPELAPYFLSQNAAIEAAGSFTGG